MDRADKFIAKAEKQKKKIWWKKYKIYLESPKWREKRAAVIKRAGGLCEQCHNKPINEVHHLTYDRVQNELLEDLQGMCLECHVEHHRKINKERKRLRLLSCQLEQKRRNEQSRKSRLKK